MGVVINFKYIIDIIIATLIILIYIGVLILARNCEKKSWNKGKCPKCGTKWTHFDNDSKGGRGYICDKCKNVIWISYHVDK